MNFAIINDECTEISEFAISGKHPNTREAWNQTFWNHFFPSVALLLIIVECQGTLISEVVWFQADADSASVSMIKIILKSSLGNVLEHMKSLDNVLKNNLKKQFGLWWAKQWVDKWKIRSIHCFDHRTQYMILQLVAGCLQQNYHWFWSCVNWLILFPRHS